MDSVLNCTGHKLALAEIVGGDGAWLVDGKGRRWLDLESGVWCTPLGHGDARVNAAIARQAGAIAHAGFCYSSAIVEEAAGAVLSIAGLEGGKCVFLCSGSEAIELGRQICAHVTGKAATLCLHDAYLGSFSAVTERKEGWHQFDWRDCASCPDRGECRRDCRKLAEIPGDISAFVFEPGSASGFVRFPPAALIGNIVDIVRARGGKILVNDVTTGMGRTGAWFGFNHYGIEPDMVAIGKGLGNGYPVSALAIGRETAAALDGGGFKYMQSHQNDPLGAAVALAVIRAMEGDRLVERAARLGAAFLGLLRGLAAGGPIREVRGRGMMFALEFADRAVCDRICEGLLERGYIVGNRGGTLRIDPPLTIAEADFHAFVDTLGDLLAGEAAPA